MRKLRPCILLAAGLASLFVEDTNAQAPTLPTKATLSTNLLSTRTFTNASAVDTVTRQRTLPASYTLQVVAKVNSATGRGLDIEGRGANLNGFRLSLGASAFSWSNPVTALQALSATTTGQFYTVRVAVKNDSAHIYQNGAYLLSKPLASVKDLVAGVETEVPLDSGAGPNVAASWNGGAGTGRPSDYGWGLTGTTVTTLFNTANGSGGARYMDVNASSGSNLHTLNGSTYSGRIFYIRWDNSTYQAASYHFPVTLAANTNYNFSMLHAYISNATGAKNITVGIGKTTAVTARIASKVFVTDGTRALKRESFQFTSQEAGTYYLTITGDWGLYSIGELALRAINFTPRFVFGKNYPSGAVNMEISSVTYEDGAWAPNAIVTGPKQSVSLTGNSQYLPTTFNTDYTVGGKTDVHLTGEYTPFVNATFALNSNDAWLFFDNIKPSVVAANWLSSVTINGAPAVNNSNVRMAPYKNGTVVIPNGHLTSQAAVQVYNQQNLTGTSATYPIEVYNNLGALNNKIRSFKLKRGYVATFANNADGTGYSRVFVANDSDLVVNNMPAGLDTTVSFVRVFKWNWVSKKGKAGAVHRWTKPIPPGIMTGTSAGALRLIMSTRPFVNMAAGLTLVRSIQKVISVTC
ncbi:hypothetical protein MKQ68_16725 [Chitinophaga horti]|uniref:Uncharacterized protein n=1 Tax=Chitinophaga horti TaxID=2920382 RepID=A0ABY6IWI0_9BACT|nr:hypothetical protein [Chitinophaga horti]UYQ91733.1 hypothetical protein MKQ68_16725 [Chitinophaga horti]